jgi:hypothetical protein
VALTAELAHLLRAESAPQRPKAGLLAARRLRPGAAAGRAAAAAARRRAEQRTAEVGTLVAWAVAMFAHATGNAEQITESQNAVLFSTVGRTTARQTDKSHCCFSVGVRRVVFALTHRHQLSTLRRLRGSHGKLG